ncbi:MAG: hypothetical protein QXL14_01725 [Candidatus Aenigmatarchaeota archaeon]
MRSTLKSKKGQFFILSTISLIIILSAISRILSFSNIPSTYEVVFRNEFLAFNNIVSKSIKTVDISRDCEDLNFNLEELKKIIKDTYEIFHIDFEYSIENCNQSFVNVSFRITLKSQVSEMGTEFNIVKNW